MPEVAQDYAAIRQENLKHNYSVTILHSMMYVTQRKTHNNCDYEVVNHFAGDWYLQLCRQKLRD